MHQHLKIGDGDVNWDEFFGGLQEIGFLDREDTAMVSSVFAEDDDAAEVSRYQLETMKQQIQKMAYDFYGHRRGEGARKPQTGAAPRASFPPSAGCSSATTPA